MIETKINLFNGFTSWYYLYNAATSWYAAFFFKEASKATDARRYDRVSYRWFLSVVIKFPLSKLNVPLMTALTLLSLKSVAAQTLQFCNFGVVQKNQTAI